MNLKLIMASVGTAAVLTLGASPATAVTLFGGPVDQTNNQAANTGQTANSNTGGTTVLLDGSSGSPAVDQSSRNSFDNSQTIASATPTTGGAPKTTIALGALGQTSNQGANTQQGATNSGSGTTLVVGGSAGGGISQHSRNDFDNTAKIGSMPAQCVELTISFITFPPIVVPTGRIVPCVAGQTSGCVLSFLGPPIQYPCPAGVTPPASPGDTSIFLGAVTQHNNQSANTGQSAINTGGGTLISFPGAGGPSESSGGATVEQRSTSDFGNEVILGGGTP